MKCLTPKSFLLLFAFVALTFALPEPENLAARAYSFYWYWIWIWRRWCIIIIYIYRFRCWIRKYDGTPVAYATALNVTADWSLKIQSAIEAQRAVPAGQATSDDAQHVVDYLTNDYSTEISAAVAEIIGQQKTIAQYNHSQGLGVQFKYIQGNQSILNSAVLNNLPSASKAGAQKAIDKINSDLASLVAAYAS